MNRSPLAAAWLALAVAITPAAADDKKADDKKADEKQAEYEKKSALEKSLRAARAEYYTAVYRGDTAAMAKIEADDFDVFHDRKDHRQDAADWRKDIDKLVKAKLWAPKRLVGETVDLAVQVNRGKWNWAVVIGAGLVETSDPKAKKEYKSFSETWDEKDGKWRLVHLHYSVGPGDDEK